MLFPNYSKLEEIVNKQGDEDVYYQEFIHSPDMCKKVPEITITCSDKLNENGVKTKKVKKENVTNIKEEDEVYVPIVKDPMLKINRN